MKRMSTKPGATAGEVRACVEDSVREAVVKHVGSFADVSASVGIVEGEGVVVEGVVGEGGATT